MQNQLGGKFSNGSVYIPTNITLNVCGLNVLIKKTKSGRLDLEKKHQEPIIGYLQENHLRIKGTHRLKVRGWKKIYHANGSSKKMGVVIIISDKLTLNSP